MLNSIVAAAKNGRLVVKKCIDQATNQQVDVLCIETDDFCTPVGKLYPDAGDALSDVYAPGGHSVERILH